MSGVLHWIETGQKIACFDVDKEEFDAMYSPCLEDPGKYIVSIGMIHGLLCLGIYVTRNSHNGKETWVMREYGVTKSWTKHAVFKDDNIVRFSRPKLVEVCDNGEMVLLPGYPEYYLILHNQKEGNCRRLRIKGFDNTTNAEIYVPSFFSIRCHVHSNYSQQQLTGTNQNTR